MSDYGSFRQKFVDEGRYNDSKMGGSLLTKSRTKNSNATALVIVKNSNDHSRLNHSKSIPKSNSKRSVPRHHTRYRGERIQSSKP